jgi:ABC-type uncharacterized transport system ATPase subunit
MKILYGFYQPDAGRILLEGKGIQLRSPLDAIRQVSFVVHAGAIFGLAGVCGNGQRELADATASWDEALHRAAIKSTTMSGGIFVAVSDAHALLHALSHIVTEGESHG